MNDRVVRRLSNHILRIIENQKGGRFFASFYCAQNSSEHQEFYEFLRNRCYRSLGDSSTSFFKNPQSSHINVAEPATCRAICTKGLIIPKKENKSSEYWTNVAAIMSLWWLRNISAVIKTARSTIRNSSGNMIRKILFVTCSMSRFRLGGLGLDSATNN